MSESGRFIASGAVGLEEGSATEIGVRPSSVGAVHRNIQCQSLRRSNELEEKQQIN
jgi:hypothetical protein